MHISLGSPLTEIKNYGSDLKLVVMNFEEKKKSARLVWESFDGTNLTGKTMVVDISETGTKIRKVDGTLKTLDLRFDGVALFDPAAVERIGNAAIAA